MDATTREDAVGITLSTPLDAPKPAGAPTPTPVAGSQADLPGLVARIEPTVVNIVATRLADGPDLSSLEDLLDLPDRHGQHHRERAVGSGVILSGDGIVLTNDHVIEDADDVRVKLSNEREVEAFVLGRDPKLDVALLKLKNVRDLPSARLGSSEAARVGEEVVAIGNPFGLGASVTTGILSGKGRSVGAGPYDALLQTDAAINPGNSGGPLFNREGEVIGINTAIVAHGKGVSFAIPIDDVRPVLRELQSTGRVSRGRIGIMFQTLDDALARAMRLPNASGALLTAIEPTSPAETVGLRPGDVVLAIDDVHIGQASELARQLGRKKPGEQVRLQILRQGRPKLMVVRLDRLDDDDGEERREIARPRPPRPAHGLGLRAADSPEGGARLQSVDPGSPAMDELKPGDVVTEMNGTPVRSAEELSTRVERLQRPGSAFFRVHRGERWLYVAVDMP